jgi:hypothetical protein
VLLHLLLALSLAAAPAAPSDSARSAADGPLWTSVLAFDELRVDADTAKVTSGGTFTVWLRWSFLDRASSPQAWDAGARGSYDLTEIDCARSATRTFSSLAFRPDGSPVPAVSFEDATAEWRVTRAETVAGMLTAQLCGMARAKR